MLKDLRISILAVALFTLLTGLGYPLLVTGIAELAFPRQAGGNLVVVDGRTRGSMLVGQSWSGDRWFHGRPPATGKRPYDARASGGSNLGPASPQLTADILERAAALRTGRIAGPLPVELLTASGSGLDPHVTPDGARFQIERVARARGLPRERVASLVEAQVEGRALGLLGEPRVNVLALNLALEQLR
ncbi:MAG: potassium-transporting ATPase subunit KdpC [Planctomycetes bacterium]|nr:potassium-transporting ATPase subunit KdpC [Planctomycetota bacterium]